MTTHRSARLPISITLLTLMCLAGCPLDAKQIGDPDDTGPGSETADSTGPADTEPEDTGTDTGDTSTDTGDTGPFDDCEGPFSKPGLDADCDGLGIGCDNAMELYNPDQLDQDDDGFGDVGDLCPLLASNSNTGDSDKDGIGNACDRCSQVVDHYRVGEIADPRLWVRNTPWNGDIDQDGVGDSCDNCVFVPNCEDYSPDNPAPHGVETSPDPDLCQADLDEDGIGDACAGVMLPQAAGVVGFGPDEDFDQDGLANLEDQCPRIPVVQVPCSEPWDCPSSATCTASGICSHVDTDGDHVGDLCDTCAAKPNPLQVTDGGMQIDDEDGDFVGTECELSQSCNIRKNSREIAFYDVSVGGNCCVSRYRGDDEFHDPEGRPLRASCSPEDEQAELCRPLPPWVVHEPNMLALTPDCEQALADAGKSEASALTLDDVGKDPAALWAFACRMPVLDQDFDGVPDSCDLCQFAHDPLNVPYTDEDDMLWPNIGAVCADGFLDTPSAGCWSD